MKGVNKQRWVISSSWPPLRPYPPITVLIVLRWDEWSATPLRVLHCSQTIPFSHLDSGCCHLQQHHKIPHLKLSRNIAQWWRPIKDYLAIMTTLWFYDAVNTEKGAVGLLPSTIAVRRLFRGFWGRFIAVDGERKGWDYPTHLKYHALRSDSQAQKITGKARFYGESFKQLNGAISRWDCAQRDDIRCTIPYKMYSVNGAKKLLLPLNELWVHIFLWNFYFMLRF